MKNDTKVLVQLHEKTINRLACRNGLCFGKLIENFGGSRAPGATDCLDDHRAEGEAFGYA